MCEKISLTALAPVVLLAPALMMGADRQHSSAQLFNIYADLISSGPVSKGKFESLKPSLQKDGFSTSDGFVWRMSDALGTVVIVALLDTGSFVFRYMPAAPTHFGDSALAAIIEKSSNVDVSDGDTIVVLLAMRTLTKVGQPGRRNESLTFSLRGAVWQQPKYTLIGRRLGLVIRQRGQECSFAPKNYPASPAGAVGGRALHSTSGATRRLQRLNFQTVVALAEDYPEKSNVFIICD
jgi:hypothetical protein